MWSARTEELILESERRPSIWAGAIYLLAPSTLVCRHQDLVNTNEKPLDGCYWSCNFVMATSSSPVATCSLPLSKGSFNNPDRIPFSVNRLSFIFGCFLPSFHQFVVKYKTFLKKRACKWLAHLLVPASGPAYLFLDSISIRTDPFVLRRLRHFSKQGSPSLFSWSKFQKKKYVEGRKKNGRKIFLGKMLPDGVSPWLLCMWIQLAAAGLDVRIFSSSLSLSSMTVVFCLAVSSRSL